jgi:hypothetical protein
VEKRAGWKSSPFIIQYPNKDNPISYEGPVDWFKRNATEKMNLWLISS